MEGEYIGRLRRRIIRIWNSKRVFGKHQEGVWRRRQRDSQGSRTKKARVRREDNEGIYSRI